MNTTILIDGNSVGYCEHYAAKLKSGDLETQAIFGFIRRMRDLRIGYPGCTPIALWDGRADWRFELCPTYKSNRDNDPKKAAIKKAYQAQRPYISRALEHLGVRQLTAMTHEADDMAGYLTKKLLDANPDNGVVLLSGDHDWWQLIQHRVVVRDVRDHSFYLMPGDFFEKTGYSTPFAFLQGKALQGDSSDVIPGVGGIGETGAREFLANFGSVHGFFKQVDAGGYIPQTRKSKDAKTLHPEQALASVEGRKAFAKNLKMMQLLNVAAPKPQDVRVVKGKPDKEKFAELCEELAFSTYLNNLDHFFKPFELE